MDEWFLLLANVDTDARFIGRFHDAILQCCTAAPIRFGLDEQVTVEVAEIDSRSELDRDRDRKSVV